MKAKGYDLVKRLAVSISLLSLSGCVLGSSSTEAAYGQWSLVDPTQQRQVLSKKYDRKQLREFAGNPTIDDGEEWVYVSKYTDQYGVVLDELLAIYYPGDEPNWKCTVITFGSDGRVCRIHVGSTPSEIYEGPSHFYFMGFGFNQTVRRRAGTVTPSPQCNLPSGK